jgi:hypothetical protein
VIDHRVDDAAQDSHGTALRGSRFDGCKIQRFRDPDDGFPD